MGGRDERIHLVPALSVHLCGLCVCVWSVSTEPSTWPTAVDRAGRAAGHSGVVAGPTSASRHTPRLSTALRRRRR